MFNGEFFTSCNIWGFTAGKARIQSASLQRFVAHCHMTRAWRLNPQRVLCLWGVVSEPLQVRDSAQQSQWTDCDSHANCCMKTTCKKHVKPSASSMLLVANRLALGEMNPEEEEAETVNSRRACQACLKYMKWPPTVFHERNYTVVVTGSAPNAKHAFFLPSIELMKAGSPSRDSYFHIFHLGGCLLDKALSHITPNYNTTCVIQTRSEEHGSTSSVTGVNQRRRAAPSAAFNTDVSY